MVAATLLFLAACAPNDGTRPPQQYPHLFDTNFGLVVLVDPPNIMSGAPNSITFVAKPLYSGTGYFTLEGGDGYGRVVAPITSELGRVNWRIDCKPGQTNTVVWTVEFIDSPDPTLVSAIAWMDSLDIDGVRYPITAPEVAYHLGDFGHQLYRRVSIAKEN
ncbi:MAG: hypothetical protein IPJ24_02625 [bacterium]|nr:hypothetical protein [bacterium]